MGKYNSSIYRVKPLFDYIYNSQDRIQMLNALLATVTLDEKKSLGDCCVKSAISEIRYEGAKNGEKPLRPKIEHLNAIIDYMRIHKPEFLQERFDCDINSLDGRISGAKTALKRMYQSDEPLPKHKAVLEGNSFPDGYIETGNEIIVIEAKWTENMPTTHTTHLEHRNQIARHIQAALALGEVLHKKVIGFFIVDEDFTTRNPEIKGTNGFTQSLTHETIDIGDKRDIIDSYFGYTTWQELDKIFDMNFDSKMDIDSKMNIWEKRENI